MSEASNAWRTEVDGTEHDIEIDHSTMTGKGTVLLDGTEVGDARMLGRKKEIEFDIDGHPGTVTLEAAYGGIGAKSALHVDGRFVEPLNR